MFEYMTPEAFPETGYQKCDKCGYSDVTVIFPNRHCRNITRSPACFGIMREWIKPSINATPLRLNIGCRNKPLPGFKNIDIVESNPYADVIDDGMKLDKFESGTVDEIHAVHMLEHLGNTDYKNALSNWFGKLKKGGRLVLSVPDMEKAAALLLLTDKKTVKSLFYGSQNDEWDFHRALHTEKSLTQDLHDVGFSNVTTWNYWEEFPYNYVDTYASCVYPHMLKKYKMDNGREIDLGGVQLSLNLKATK